MTTDQRYESKQRIHWAVKPIIKASLFMVSECLKNFEEHTYPATDVSMKINNAMERAEHRIAPFECKYDDDRLEGHLKKIRLLMVMLSNAERELMKDWIKIYIEEFQKEGLA